jgi:hypothetical protein
LSVSGDRVASRNGGDMVRFERVPDADEEAEDSNPAC